jgi:hypothetical protein
MFIVSLNVCVASIWMCSLLHKPKRQLACSLRLKGDARLRLLLRYQR